MSCRWSISWTWHLGKTNTLAGAERAFRTWNIPENKKKRHPFTRTCNAWEAIGINVEQEELANAKEPLKVDWPWNRHHANETQVLHGHHQHAEGRGGRKEHRGFRSDLPKIRPKLELLPAHEKWWFAQSTNSHGKAWYFLRTPPWR